MVLWPFITVAILLFLFFYPIAFKVDVTYSDNCCLGKVILYPFFGAAKPGIVIWDSQAPEKEKKEGRSKEKKQKKKKSKAKSKKSLPIQDIIVSCADILRSAGKGIKRLRIKLFLAYAWPEPDIMGYVTGALYGIIPVVMGDPNKSRWHIELYPDWQCFETMVYCRAEIKLSLFDIFYAFGGILIKTIKLLIKILRRREDVPSHRNINEQCAGKSEENGGR